MEGSIVRPHEAPGGAAATADLEAFRRRVVSFLEARYRLRDPEGDDDRVDIISRTPDGHEALVSRARELQAALADAGLAGLDVPVEYGGQGLTAAHERVLTEELTRFDTPSRRPLGITLGLALPTLLAAASEEQKRRHIPALLRGEELWCQLFSEPDAGSDLASLRTRAVLDGDQWLIDGQKVWSSYASDARYGMLLARTDPDADRRQAGITMFILPMDAPGVTVRPLIDIAGGRHFNEVFLAGVALPVDSVIGEVNRGWQVATGTLGGERAGYLGGSGGGRRERQVVAAARRSGRAGDPVVRQAVASVIAGERVLELLAARVHAGAVAGGNPATGSLVKLAAGNLEQRAAETIADLVGLAGVAWDAGDRDGDVVSHALNASRQATIAGGTHEIQRNILGERVLGLPR